MFTNIQAASPHKLAHSFVMGANDSQRLFDENEVSSDWTLSGKETQKSTNYVRDSWDDSDDEEYENCIWDEDEGDNDDTILIGTGVVEKLDSDGKFIGFADPSVTREIVMEQTEVVVPKKQGRLTNTIAPWANKKVEVAKVNDDEFPALGTVPKKKEQPKKVKAVKKTNNVFDALAEEEQKKQSKKKAVWKKFEIKRATVKVQIPAKPINTRRAKAFHTMGDKKEMTKKLEKTTMCTFGKRCRRRVCHFAHNLEELKPRECLFGADCRHGKKCRFFHPHCEDKAAFLKRTAHTHTHTHKRTQHTHKRTQHTHKRTQHKH